MIWIALFFEDGSVGRMQYAGSRATIQAEIDKSVFESPVKSWRVVKKDDFPADKTRWGEMKP